MRITVLTVAAPDAELAADRLRTAGARAIEERRDAAGSISLLTVLADDDDVSRERFGEVPEGWTLGFVEVDPRPSETWREHVAPVVVAPDLILRPAWLSPSEQPDVLEIAIEPGGAFGLGDHPTTRLSAAAVNRIVEPGSRVLDVGCGSGVLSVIAARRGASTVTAIDISDAAVEATLDNVHRNGVADIVQASTMPIDQLDGEYDIVVANILAPVLIALSDDLDRLTARSGTLIVSGLLAGQHDGVVRALRGMELVRSDELEHWEALEFEPR